MQDNLRSLAQTTANHNVVFAFFATFFLFGNSLSGEVFRRLNLLLLPCCRWVCGGPVAKLQGQIARIRSEPRSDSSNGGEMDGWKQTFGRADGQIDGLTADCFDEL